MKIGRIILPLLLAFVVTGLTISVPAPATAQLGNRINDPIEIPSDPVIRPPGNGGLDRELLPRDCCPAGVPSDNEITFIDCIEMAIGPQAADAFERLINMFARQHDGDFVDRFCSGGNDRIDRR